jgi:hypothetical protein
MDQDLHDGATPRKRRCPLPPPPTEPPPALVRLLQDDAEVRQYFGALQAHLDADVRKWKERAIALKQENQSLKSSAFRREERTTQASSSKQKNDESRRKKPRTNRKANGSESKQPDNKDAPKMADSSHFSSLDDEEGAYLEPNSVSTVQVDVVSLPIDVGVPIEDSMFDDMDSDEEEEERLKTEQGSSTIVVPANEVPDIFPFLKEAFDIFKRLGIALVTDYNLQVESSSSHSDVVDTEAANSSVEYDCNVKAISTDHVMSDILRNIATNRLMVTASSPYPDATSGLNYDATPSDYFTHAMDETGKTSRDDPFRKGNRFLVRAFVLIDTFCAPSIPQTEWDRFFPRSPTKEVTLEELECMKIGLRSRKQLVDRLILFLNQAIRERWVLEDSAQRLLNTRVHFGGKEEIKIEIDAADFADVKRSLFCGNLLERSSLCQLATCLLLLRNDMTNAIRNILQYAAVAAPQANVDEVSKLPPLLSLVSLESLLLISDPSMLQLLPIEGSGSSKTEKASTWFHRHVLKLYPQAEEQDRFYDSLALAVHLSAAIWESRLASTQDTIHDVAAIEMLSYKRLVFFESEWLNTCDLTNMHGISDCFRRYCDEGRYICFALLENDCWRNSPVVDVSISKQVFRCLTLEISLLLSGDNGASLNQVVDRVLRLTDLSLFSDGQATRFYDFLIILANIARLLELRRCDLSVASNLQESCANVLFKIGDCSVLWSRIRGLSSLLGVVDQVQLLLTAVKCFGTLADGSSVLSVLDALKHVAWSHVPEPLKNSVFDQVRQLSACPVVRVINLERRKDRMQSFLQLALRERLLTLKAVVDLNVDLPEDDGYEFGRHAVDGSGRLVEATECLVQFTGSLDQLNNLVSSHWRPNDLKPFDVDAPSSESLVRISPSERACALSHLSSWKGALRSLQCTAMDFSGNDDYSSLPRLTPHIARLFKISGFAKGPALLPQNKRMPPTPVCVILEDDAILVERFRERLEAVLLELPRDFHFCSLGYGRPKSAPIVPFSEHIGVPSMLWYLTGYCLSAAGAQYLLDALPIVGPVDSWIGLKMTNNLDNIFGTKLGVGSHGKPKPSDLPSRDDLRRILQFHAYCAVPPLCSQKVRLLTTAATGGAVVAPTRHGRHWRQRDTDIEYSGAAVSTMMEDESLTQSRRR